MPPAGTLPQVERRHGRRTAMESPLLSVVMPVFNERKTIDEIIGRVLAVPMRVELIVVDDCSRDGTREHLVELQRRYGFNLLLQERNQGKGAALRRGFAAVTGDIVVIQDADLEYSPEEFPELVELIVEGRADVVYGSRFLGRGRQGKLTFYLANRGLAVLTNALYGSHLSDIETCYKVLRRDVIPRLKLRAARFEIEPELTAQVLKAGLRLVEVPVGYAPRTHDEGKKISWKDGFTAVYTLLAQRVQ